MDETELWFGTLNGITIVYDLRFKFQGHVGCCCSQLSISDSFPIERHTPEALRSHCVTTTPALPPLELMKAGARAGLKQRSPKPATMSIAKMRSSRKKFEDIIHKHRRSLEKESLTYQGVTEPDGRGFMRNSSCRACHRAIGSDTHLICNSSKWIVCSSCGTCGCQRRP